MAAGTTPAFVAGQRDVLEGIAGGVPLPLVLEGIVRLVEQQADGMLCSILLLDEEQGRVRHGAAPSLPAEYSRAIDGMAIGPTEGSCGTAAYKGEPVVVEDIATDPLWEHYRDLALPLGLRACWSSPIFSGDRRVLGTFAIYYRQPRGPTAVERVWGAAATHLAAVAIGRDRMEQALRRSVHDLGERVKELTVLHGAARLLQGDRAIDHALLGELVRLLPPGWQYPDVCVARLQCGDVVAETPGWRATPWTQSAVFPAGEQSGRIEVAYLDERPPAAEGPFLAEERALLESLADMLGAHAEHRQAEADRARLEAELRQAQRIQALGTLAGGIAHDFNNVLTAIVGNAENAAGALPADHRAQRSLHHIVRASERGGDLIQRILMFSRRQEPQRRQVDLRDVVAEALKLLRATLPAAVRIETSFDPTTPAVLADPTQVYQVVTNLGTNAAHAMGQAGGCLTVELEPVMVAAGAASPAPGLRPGRWARLSVRDTGCGMDAATLERIFEPFFTTKPVGEGTGLGLSVVHGIVKSHEGAITVDSRPGAGTRFHVYFPEAQAPAVPAAAAPPADSGGRGEHVLYVDDEEALIYMASRLLERAGYRVSGFTDSRRALEAFRAAPATFDAVVTDLAMPGLSGPALAREIRQSRPDVPLVFTSGYVRPEEAERLREFACSEVIPKPDLLTGLAPALQRLLVTPAARTPTPAAPAPPPA